LEQQALIRWEKIAQFIDQEVINLQNGLNSGYSAAKPVVKRVVQQLDALMATSLEKSPFNALLVSTASAEYLSSMKVLLKSRLLVSLTAYRDFLVNHYLVFAREQLTVTTNPNGASCYKALLRYNTTLKRTPEQVFQLGQKTVNERSKQVVALGKEFFHSTDFSSTITHVNNMETDRFSSKGELLNFAREAVKRAGSEEHHWFGKLPKSSVVVTPFPTYQEGTGVSPNYDGPVGDKPGIYWIPLYQPEKQSRGRVEITAFHEAFPGHHLQIAHAKELGQAHQVESLILNSGYVEGWARYSEMLAEEMGLYSTQTARVLRRAWPARGMVVDPGIHAFGWTRQQAVDYIVASGSFNTEVANALVDRIANIPGQLTSYDSGGLEIMALRKMAEQKLGEKFDIKTFHDKTLENGAITLPMLKSHIEYWIETQN